MNRINNCLNTLIPLFTDVLAKIRDNTKVIVILTETEAETLVSSIGSEILYPELMYLEIQTVEEATRNMDWDLCLFKPEAVNKFFLSTAIPEDGVYITYVSRSILEHPIVKETNLKDLFTDDSVSYVGNISYV